MQAVSLGLALAVAALFPVGALALSTTNSETRHDSLMDRLEIQ